MKSQSFREVSTLLKQGATGANVTTLQTKLRDRNFDPGSVDGIFGIGTKKALMAFQTSVGLTADGIAGKNTWAALNAAETTGSSTLTLTTLQKLTCNSF